MEVKNLPESLRKSADYLRGLSPIDFSCEWVTCRRAADEIERLRAIVEQCSEALNVVAVSIWRDKRSNTCGLTGASAAVHAVEFARKALRAAKAAREHTAQVKNCTTCRSLVGCEEARGGGQEGFTCWKPRKEKH